MWLLHLKIHHILQLWWKFVHASCKACIQLLELHLYPLKVTIVTQLKKLMILFLKTKWELENPFEMELTMRTRRVMNLRLILLLSCSLRFGRNIFVQHSDYQQWSLWHLNLANLSKVSIEKSYIPSSNIFCIQESVELLQGQLEYPSKVQWISLRFMLRSNQMMELEAKVMHNISELETILLLHKHRSLL